MAKRKGLSREAVVACALQQIDASGPEKLTARSLAAALEVQPMAIYHYFPNMDALLDAVVEEVLGTIVLPEPSGAPRADLLALHKVYIAALKRHPNAIGLVVGRRFNSPGTLPLLDAIFSVLSSAGLSPRDIATAFRIQGYFVNGALLAYAATLEAARRPDFRLDDPSFLGGHPLVAEVVPFLRAEELDRILAEGLELVLDGLEKRWSPPVLHSRE